MMHLLIADHTIKQPVGIVYNVLVKVDKYIFPAYFVILDYKVDVEIPILLGRPFLAIERALVDVESGELKFQVNNEEVTFNVCKSMKQPNNLNVLSIINIVDDVVPSVYDIMGLGKSMASMLLNYDGKEIEGYDEEVAAWSDLGSHFKAPPKLALHLKNRESPPIKPYIKEPPKLELKILPFYLNYAFLGGKNYDYCS